MDDIAMEDPGAVLEDRFGRQRSLARAEIEVPWPVRRDRLQRLRALLLEHEQEFAAAIAADFGARARQETRLLELLPSLEGIRHALGHTRTWMRPRARHTGRWFLPARSEVLPQPLGVVGIVAPWNYPLLLVAGPLTAAFAAGNRAMAKLSEFTPAFGARFAARAAEYFTAEELWVANGGVELAQAFCALPFDHLLFTGSTRVGGQVMRAASENLTPVTLELGGKSPALIGPSADFPKAVERIMAGKLLNAGQTCIAPDYVLLPEGRVAAFIAAARAFVATRYPGLGDPKAAAAQPDYTSIIDGAHFERLARLVEDAVSLGAERVSLADGAGTPFGRQFLPVVLTGVPASAQVMQEEIFGPILPLMPYRSLAEALAFVNARPRPLAFYLFERDARVIREVLHSTVSGGVCVNETLLHIAQDDLPFGGIGPSGMGAYHGEKGFETFSHYKPVFRQSRLNLMKLFLPPYGRRFDALVRVLVR